MNVVEYIKKHGVEKLQEEFAIIVTDYPDRVVLNYNQIDSPRFHPVVDECRALILRKGTWEVLARSFNRFYNIGEGHCQGFDRVRIAADEETVIPYDFSEVRIYEKLDGSLMSVYYDGDGWQVSTRKMAFAEGQTTFGRTFADVFWSVANKKYDLKNILVNEHTNTPIRITLVFELTGPENRVVTPYSEPDISLLAVRNNKSEREFPSTDVDAIALQLGVPRPKQYIAKSPQELVELVSNFPTMEEGIVMVIDANTPQESFLRIKCKNPSFVAIAHMRENGGISPKNIMNLVLTNEHHEYLGYFPEDKQYFDFVEQEYRTTVQRIKMIYRDNMAIESQKDFALAIMPKTVYGFEKGVIFKLRKDGGTVEDHLKDLGGKKIVQAMGMKEKFLKNFGLESEDE